MTYAHQSLTKSDTQTDNRTAKMVNRWAKEPRNGLIVGLNGYLLAYLSNVGYLLVPLAYY